MSKVIPGGHIVLTVKDLKKSSEWYKEILGWLDYKPVFEDERNVYFGNKNAPGYIAIFQGHKEFENDTFNRYRLGFHHLAIRVKEQKIVDEFFKFLKTKNVEVTEEPTNYPEYGDEIYYAVFFSDPDGLRLEIFYEKK